MSNPILRKEDITAIAEQFEELEARDSNVRVNSVTIALTSGVTATFTRANENNWQATIAGRPDQVLGGYRDR